jgi:hypothetical protein
LALISLLLPLCGCSLLDLLLQPAEPTTKEKMIGVWEVTEATDETGASILNDIKFPIAAIQLSEGNSLNSTAGPMFMKIVYGKSQYTKIASQIDQVFQYASLDLTEGEWFITGGYPERFTAEIKLEGLPGQKSLTTLLNTLGIAQNYLDVTVYHKFIDVHVTFDHGSDTIMTWEFDNQTTAVYNTKDSQGNYVLWNGWPVSSFGRFRFVMTKRVKTIRQLIQGAPAPKSGVTLQKPSAAAR